MKNLLNKYLIPSLLLLTILTVPVNVSSQGKLQQAILHRMQLPDGRNYVRHCREYPGGCVTRVKSFVEALQIAQETYGVDPYVMTAIALHESGLNPNAVGQRRSELTVFQINRRRVEYQYLRHTLIHIKRVSPTRRYAVWRDVGLAEIQGTLIAAKILAGAQEQCGSVNGALRMYNSGSCTASSSYARRVLRTAEILRQY